jgi:tRNA G18 (ribose-2'-O)-methylase SpoU
MAKNKKKKIIIKNKFINSGFEKKSKDGSFLIFGRKPIFEQLEKSSDKVKKIYIIDSSHEEGDVKKIYELAKNNKISIENINSKTASGKLGKVNHQGVAAQVSKFEYGDQMD